MEFDDFERNAPNKGDKILVKYLLLPMAMIVVSLNCIIQLIYVGSELLEITRYFSGKNTQITFY